ncbi:MAG: hypothetical protein OXH86_17800 [Acidimicrobiaceae bacterium]|nr:hypothetical protein [Acidimicrobiaceae bacterium]MDE0499196.1 hypothetical protein [Acidimicrobiaceae bacterium]
MLLTPPIQVETATMYNAWDTLGGLSGPNTNDLEPPALAAYPELSRRRDDLAAAIGRTQQLAGNGGTRSVPAQQDEPLGLIHHVGVSTVRARAIDRV